MDRHARRRGDLLDPVARDPRLRAGLPARLPAVRALGRDAHDAGGLPDPGRRASSSATSSSTSRSTPRIIVGTALVIAGIGLVNSRFGRRRLFGRRRSRPPRPRGRPSALSSPPRAATRPPTISTDAPIRRAASERSLASPIRTEPQAAAKTVADSRSGATPDSGATLRATRMHRYATSVSQPPTAARRAASGP